MRPTTFEVVTFTKPPPLAGVSDLTLVIYENPDALIFKGSHEGTLYARVCGECGYTELFLDNPRELYEIYQNRKDNEA